MKPKRKDVPNWPGILFVVAAIYFVAAYTVFRFRHPDMSETQLLLHFWEAMTWCAAPPEGQG